MSWSVIVKNIYTFANILSQASTDTVNQWDERSLINAFNWAKYSQKIAEQSQGKPFSADLDRQIQTLTLLLKPVSLLHLDLNQLTSACLLLKQVLLLNPATPDHILESLLYDCIRDEQSEDGLVKLGIKLLHHYKKSNALRDLCTSIGGDDVWQDVQVRAQSRFIGRTLSKLYTQSSCKDRFKSYLEQLLKAITTKKDGWPLIASLFKELTSTDELSGADAIVKQTTEWILKCDQLQRDILSLTPEVATSLTSGHTELLDLYIGALIQFGDNMEPVYGLTDTGDLYTWRYKGDDSTISYDTFKQHVHCLLNSDNSDSVKTATLKLKQLGQSSHCNVWRDIVK